MSNSVEARQVCVLPTSHTLVHRHPQLLSANTSPNTHVKSSHLSIPSYLSSLPRQRVRSLAGNLYLALNFNDIPVKTRICTHTHTQNEPPHYRSQHSFVKCTATAICLIFLFYDHLKGKIVFFLIGGRVGLVRQSFASHGQNLC